MCYENIIWNRVQLYYWIVHFHFMRIKSVISHMSAFLPACTLLFIHFVWRLFSLSIFIQSSYIGFGWLKLHEQCIKSFFHCLT